MRPEDFEAQAAVDAARECPDVFAELLGFNQSALHAEMQAHLSKYGDAAIGMPRGHGKSVQLGIRQAWEIGRNPAIRIKHIGQTVVKAQELRFSETGVKDIVRRILLRWWNAYSFFTTYANAEGIRAVERTDATGVLDRYILAKTRALVEDVTERMDGYDIAGACGSIQSYLDALTNWYIRRSRERFWSPGTDDRSGDEGTASYPRDDPLQHAVSAEICQHLRRKSLRAQSRLDDGDGARHASVRSDHCSTSSAARSRRVTRPITSSHDKGLMPVPGRLYVMSDSAMRCPEGRSLATTMLRRAF